jgi:hypothetical protein
MIRAVAHRNEDLNIEQGVMNVEVPGDRQRASVRSSNDGQSHAFCCCIRSSFVTPCSIFDIHLLRNRSSSNDFEKFTTPEPVPFPRYRFRFDKLRMLFNVRSRVPTFQLRQMAKLFLNSSLTSHGVR